MDAQTSFLGDFGELGTNCCVQERHPATNFATEWMKKGVVTCAWCAAKGLVVAFGGEFDGVTEAESTADLEFPVVEVKSGLLGG